MLENRDYTGLVRAPSSMAWLNAESAKINGKIAKLEKQQAEIPARLAVLRQQLDALAPVIPLHEVKVDPTEIAPVRERRKPITAYGKMTSAVCACLREHRTPGASDGRCGQPAALGPCTAN